MRKVSEQEARDKKKITANELARGVGQYVALMYSVQALDQIIAYLQIERARIVSFLTEPLKVPKAIAKEAAKDSPVKTS